MENIYKQTIQIISNYMPKRNNQSIEQKIIIGFFRGIWWILSLPFRKRKKRISTKDKKYFLAKKQEILNIAETNDKIKLSHTLFEADKLVDNALKSQGFSGATFAERLRKAEKSMPKSIYQNIWAGHKIRNIIAHETGGVHESEIKNAIKKLLSYLEVL
ncbi:MAG: Uncharacterized protein Athens101428_454 [Candidatus Berkelbacteria bacterium Athens1014_28]|uniref:DUF4145 domain-containing protein n=1 Tax=Candidatus Berkelbacteria bacterium Athens1014_28 TaxID=2017145 RepID=A0A554LM62_9BACT|nr:MAG: Uncharacterized protein Athens101428_454 [Candidatus Berkelbacteria bacterium Athens1014_28]